MLRLLLVLGMSAVAATNSTAQSNVAVVNTTGFGGASVVFKTGFADVACAGGVCLVPGGGGYNIQEFGHGFGHGFGSGFNNAVAVIPQSTAFFALSNPNVFKFRVRDFVQVHGTNAIITTDSYGNVIEFLNAGIHSGGRVQSRGQTIFVR